MNDLEQALRILRGSKQYNFNGTVLTVIGYYTGKRISLDLGKLDADMLEALTPDEEADDGDIWSFKHARLANKKIPLHWPMKSMQGGFCMPPGRRNVKIKSGTSFSRYATLYKSHSFSSGSILAGVYVSVKPFWYSAPRS